MTTLKDIAKACDVSVSTVSRAFDKSSRISLPVRQRILFCAEAMGYTPNLIARSLKSNRSMTIALIVPDIENRFYIDVLKHLELALHRYGYRLLVNFVQHGTNTERECLEMMVATKVDAIILIPCGTENEEYIASLQNQIRFIQLFSAPFQQIDSVVMDDIGGAALGARYLLERKHRRILYAGGQDRQEGFWHAVDNAGIPRNQIKTLPWTTTIEEACAAISEFQPTAVFSVAYTSETIWSALHQLKLSIPDDISMIVYDDTNWVSLVELTAVAHNLEEITTTVVTQLMKRLNEDDVSSAVHIVLDPFIVERQSVRMLENDTQSQKT